MINNSNIKFNARLRLRGKWPAVLCILGLTCGMTIAPSLLQVLQSLFIGEMPEPEAAFSASNAELLEIALKALISIFISLAVFTAQILLVNPISMGQYSYYWKNADGQEPQPDTVFMWFRKGRYSRAVCTVLLVNLFKTLWGLLCLSPAVFSALFTIGLASTVKPSVLVLLAFFSVTVIFAGIGGYIYLRIIQRYFLAPYLVTMYDNISASQAISLSKTMMFSHGQNALNFQLSFIGWYLLCFFILPIMYVIPYVNQSCAEYAHAVIDMENKKMAEAYARHEEMMRAAYPVIDSPIPEPTVTESPAAEIEEAPPIIENDFTATDGSEE